MASPKLDPPFPYFGGKSRIAHTAWVRFGKPEVFVEPFCGSAATLLHRPNGASGYEIINDMDCMVTNFWRATKLSPHEVALYANRPPNEIELLAAHQILGAQPVADELRAKLVADPNFHDARLAGWWCWFLCCDMSNGYRLTLKNPNCIKPAVIQQGVCRVLRGSTPNQSEADRCEFLCQWFSHLRHRLRDVNVSCGDWKRVCTHSLLVSKGLLAVLFDPPYPTAAGRDPNLYREESLTVASEVEEWCAQYGSDKGTRIALCGYEGTHENLESLGWSVMKWSSSGGSNKPSTNRHKERIWFSPHCLKAGFFT